VAALTAAMFAPRAMGAQSARRRRHVVVGTSPARRRHVVVGTSSSVPLHDSRSDDNPSSCRTISLVGFATDAEPSCWRPGESGVPMHGSKNARLSPPLRCSEMPLEAKS
jgi:hypothetical protein